MENTINLTEQRLAEAWAVLQAHGDVAGAMKPDANRLAFADPEFLLRRELRGMRMQMELLKPELGQVAAGVENTVVVFGGARFCSPEDAQTALAQAQASGDAAQVRLITVAGALKLSRHGPMDRQRPARFRGEAAAVAGDDAIDAIVLAGLDGELGGLGRFAHGGISDRS
ncbi:MAG: hypothetical protein HC765_03620 [Brachymonas sp.]|nr:hypothetical protein [Brachymonas sp.]